MNINLGLIGNICFWKRHRCEMLLIPLKMIGPIFWKRGRAGLFVFFCASFSEEHIFSFFFFFFFFFFISRVSQDAFLGHLLGFLSLRIWYLDCYWFRVVLLITNYVTKGLRIEGTGLLKWPKFQIIRFNSLKRLEVKYTR